MFIPIIIHNSGIPCLFSFGNTDMYGITIFPFIFIINFKKLNKPAIYSKEEVINHEKFHIQQMIETGVIGFYVLFACELLVKSILYKSIRLGYENISFEIEAYKNMKNMNYLHSRTRYNWIKLLYHSS